MRRVFFFAAFVLSALAAGEAGASLVGGDRCGSMVVVERAGTVTIVRHFPRPCPRGLFVVPPSARVGLPHRHFGLRDHVRRDLDRRHLFVPKHRRFEQRIVVPPPHRRFEQRVIVPPLAVRPLFPPPRHRPMLRREWR